MRGARCEPQPRLRGRRPGAATDVRQKPAAADKLGRRFLRKRRTFLKQIITARIWQCAMSNAVPMPAALATIAHAVNVPATAVRTSIHEAQHVPVAAHHANRHYVARCRWMTD